MRGVLPATGQGLKCRVVSVPSRNCACANLLDSGLGAEFRRIRIRCARAALKISQLVNLEHAEPYEKMVHRLEGQIVVELRDVEIEE